MPLGDVAPQLRQAVVATEDERFWRHHGIDTIGLVRAAAYDVSHLSLAQGASTITEQLGKDLYLGGNDHSAWRKLEDMVIAVRLEAALSKEQILDLYLNEVYSGHGATGIAAASATYFGVSPAHLTLGQASLLAGLVQAPSLDDPFTDPDAARSRQVEVLTSMMRSGDITASEARRALDAPLLLAGGASLPALAGLSVQPGPRFSALPLVAGALLLVLGCVGYALLRRRGTRFAWRAGAVLGCTAGLILVARAFNVDQAPRERRVVAPRLTARRRTPRRSAARRAAARTAAPATGAPA
ncbi:MAG: transglycosylase domain-containing protein [Actinomycetota bacterium]